MLYAATLAVKRGASVRGSFVFHYNVTDFMSEPKLVSFARPFVPPRPLLLKVKLDWMGQGEQRNMVRSLHGS